jgi:hypothetical protein
MIKAIAFMSIMLTIIYSIFHYMSTFMWTFLQF